MSDSDESSSRKRPKRKEKPKLPPLELARVEHLNLKELKDLCKERYLAVTGTKPVLIARLTGQPEPPPKIHYDGPDPAEMMISFFNLKVDRPGFRGASAPDPTGGGDDDSGFHEQDELSDTFLALLDDADDEFRKELSVSAAFCFDKRYAISKPPIKIITPQGQAPLVLPLTSDGDKLFKQLCKPAPFGRGEDTIVDLNVRNTLQLDPDQFTITDENFLRQVSNSHNSPILEDIRQALAPTSTKVTATLYKLLYYPRGSFFKPHVDTQRGPDMFATLVIELEEPMQGGDLLISHNSQNVRIHGSSSSSSSNSNNLRVTAFFANCLHEVTPVETGCRIALIYNLTRSGAAPSPPKLSGNAALEAVRDIYEYLHENDDDAFLGYLLAHSYAVTSRMPESLKGSDAAIYRALKDEFNILVVPITMIERGVDGDDSPTNAYSIRQKGRCEREENWRSTYLIDPRKAPQKQGPREKQYYCLHRNALETLVKIHWLTPDPAGIAQRIGQDLHPTGNEGAGYALSYVHFAMFIESREEAGDGDGDENEQEEEEEEDGEEEKDTTKTPAAASSSQSSKNSEAPPPPPPAAAAIPSSKRTQPPVEQPKEENKEKKPRKDAKK